MQEIRILQRKLQVAGESKERFDCLLLEKLN